MAIGLFDIHGCVGETPKLEITSPIFDKVTLTFPSLDNHLKTTQFEIITNKKNPDDLYIQHAILNQKPWNDFQFPVSEFFKGGTLELELGPQPNKNWGTKK